MPQFWYKICSKINDHELKANALNEKLNDWFVFSYLHDVEKNRKNEGEQIVHFFIDTILSFPLKFLIVLEDNNE